MLAVRVIPTLLMRGPHLVKGKQFSGDRIIGSALQAARVHNMRGVDELIMLDIGTSPEGRGPDLKLVEQISRDCFCPLTVGGGVRSVQDVRDLLNAGADKVAIKRMFQIIPEAADKIGCQAIVAAMDVAADGEWFIPLGAGEILLTSMHREGTMQGYDIDLIRAVSSAVDIPVIAHGGCGSYEDMRLAIEAGASGVAAGALFSFSDATPKGAAQYLAEHNIEVRV